MKKICIIVFLFLTLGGFMSSCSNERTKENPRAMKGKKSLEEKIFQKEPKAPESALNGMDEGKLLEEEHSNALE
jgi:hypothetical protein